MPTPQTQQILWRSSTRSTTTIRSVSIARNEPRSQRRQSNKQQVGAGLSATTTVEAISTAAGHLAEAHASPQEVEGSQVIPFTSLTGPKQKPSSLHHHQRAPPAATNSRVRQGALYARRQYHITAASSSAELLANHRLLSVGVRSSPQSICSQVRHSTLKNKTNSKREAVIGASKVAPTFIPSSVRDQKRIQLDLRQSARLSRRPQPGAAVNGSLNAQKVGGISFIPRGSHLQRSAVANALDRAHRANVSALLHVQNRAKPAARANNNRTKSTSLVNDQTAKAPTTNRIANINNNLVKNETQRNINHIFTHSKSTSLARTSMTNTKLLLLNTSKNSSKTKLPFAGSGQNLATNSDCLETAFLEKEKLSIHSSHQPVTTIADSTHIGSVEEQMVIGSPLVTPPPSDPEIDEDEEDTVKPQPKRASLEKTLDGPIDIAMKTEPIGDFYDLESRPFARGKFAQVKRCIKKTSKQCFAAKCVKKLRRLVDIRHEILLEIEALKLSSYTNHIVKLYEVYETPNEMILVLEMANGGELQRVLDDEEVIEEPLAKRMIRQILEGLIQLHDNDIAHLDIKPQNLLLTEQFPDGDIKLCDFGMSRRIAKGCEIREICGTPDYVAPEILRYDPISLKTDMWSLGVLTYVILSGCTPFGSDNKQQTFCNITQAALEFPSDIFDKISSDAVDFMQKLIVREPSQRLTSKQAIGHKWLINK